MVKIEANTDRSFLINGIPYQKGQYEISPLSNETQIKIVRVGSDTVVTQAALVDWRDAGDLPFADFAAFVSYTEPFFFRSVTGGGGGGAVDSVFSRTGAVTAQNGDYNSTQVTNNSGIVGANVTDALNNLQSGDPAWENVGDTQYTEVSPFAVVGGTTVKMPNNAGSRLNTYMPVGIKFWNEVTQKVTPQGVGEVYSLRVNFKAKSSTVTNSFDILLDIGGTQGIILESVATFPKGSGIETPFSSTTSVFIGATFIANGGDIQINPVDDIEIYDISFFISRLSANDLNLPDAPSDGTNYVRKDGAWSQLLASGLIKESGISATAFNGGLDLSGNTYYSANVSLPSVIIGDTPRVSVSQQLMDAARSAGVRLSDVLYTIPSNGTVTVYVNVSSFLAGNANFKAYAEIIK